METTTKHGFERLAAAYPLVPVARTIIADTETPVGAYLKLTRGREADVSPWSFLLESVEGGTRWGRYSLVGCSPLLVVEIRGGEVVVRQSGPSGSDREGEEMRSDDPLGVVRGLLAAHRMPSLEHLPRFCGGLVGYLGYGAAGLFERLPASPTAGSDPPDGLLFAPRRVVAFDNLAMTVTLISLARASEGGPAYERALAELDEMESLLAAPLPARQPSPEVVGSPGGARAGESTGLRSRSILRAHIERERFEAMVADAREAVHDGEAIQVVLSQAFSADTEIDPLDVYRALRRLNPSPCMFYLELDAQVLTGASPEPLVRVEGDRATVRPIAGTRPRGDSPEQDMRLETELVSDAKERAEHVMLVDLARNDLGRVAIPGGVTVEESFAVERYSHVMHLVSTVSAELRDEVDLVDVLAATFPAGTVSGAPKLRAMELIASLEPEARGPYAGSVGYLGFDGSMDTCITIRALAFHGGRVHIQAGAGVVADSDPAAEYLETLHKCGTMFAALEAAGGPVPGCTLGLPDPGSVEAHPEVLPCS